ncbi:MAG TPA: hypothetical protein VHE35_25405 [Kofleriaceae bacterium]|nr:hypothetical protein [Kofleriaceae bacterium]
MDRRLRPRRSLFDVALAGGRARWHRALRRIIGGLAAVTALLVGTEQHRVCDSWGHCDASDWGPSHTLVHDLGPMPIILLAFVGGLQLMGYQRKLGAGLGTSIGSAVTALYVLGSATFAHFLSSTEGGDGAVMGLLVLFALCLFQIVLEPVLAARQRRLLEASDPVFPHAAVVRR